MTKSTTARPSRAEIIAVGPGFKSRLHWSSCLLALFVLRRFLHSRGIRRTLRLLARIFGHENYAIFKVFDEREIKVYLSDAYWIIPMLESGNYERAVKHLLANLLTEDTVFLDCGANIGWWSIFASTRIPSQKNILAIEASPVIFERLRENAELNSGAFVPLNAAVWFQTGEQLAVRLNHHSTPSVADRMRTKAGENQVPPNLLDHHGGDRAEEDPIDNGNARPEVSATTHSLAIDDVMNSHFPGLSGPVIAKLDVEGAESEALRGASRLLKSGPLIIYEDHGMYVDCVPTRSLMEAGFSIFYCDNSLFVHRLPDLGAVRQVKRDREKAYNFAACPPHSPFYTSLMKMAEEEEPPEIQRTSV